MGGATLTAELRPWGSQSCPPASLIILRLAAPAGAPGRKGTPPLHRCQRACCPQHRLLGTCTSWEKSHYCADWLLWKYVLSHATWALGVAPPPSTILSCVPFPKLLFHTSVLRSPPPHSAQDLDSPITLNGRIQVLPVFPFSLSSLSLPPHVPSTLTVFLL